MEREGMEMAFKCARAKARWRDGGKGKAGQGVGGSDGGSKLRVASGACHFARPRLLQDQKRKVPQSSTVWSRRKLISRSTVLY